MPDIVPDARQSCVEEAEEFAACFAHTLQVGELSAPSKLGREIGKHFFEVNGRFDPSRHCCLRLIESHIATSRVHDVVPELRKIRVPLLPALGVLETSVRRTKQLRKLIKPMNPTLHPAERPVQRRLNVFF